MKLKIKIKNNLVFIKLHSFGIEGKIIIENNSIELSQLDYKLVQKKKVFDFNFLIEDTTKTKINSEFYPYTILLNKKNKTPFNFKNEYGNNIKNIFYSNI